MSDSHSNPSTHSIRQFSIHVTEYYPRIRAAPLAPILRFRIRDPGRVDPLVTLISLPLRILARYNKHYEDKPAFVCTVALSHSHPAEPEEITWFVMMMKKAAPKFAGEDMKLIETALRSQKK